MLLCKAREIQRERMTKETEIHRDREREKLGLGEIKRQAVKGEKEIKKDREMERKKQKRE